MNSVLQSCRACKATDLRLILSLGQTPLANSLVQPDQLGHLEITYPLDLVFCASCSLVQITVTVPPDMLFREYLYFSSCSFPVVRQAEILVERMVTERCLDGSSLAMEIASNDGYLLQHYKKQGVPVLGIEPARNVAKVAVKERGIRTLTEFFGEELAYMLESRGDSADIIHANNVLAHVSDLNGVVNGIRIVLKQKGIASIEVPYVRDLIEGCEFDTIYHEHLCYFSLTALDQLFRRNQMVISDVERISVHGGSIRVYASHLATATPSPSVTKMLDDEDRLGIGDYRFYDNFAIRVERLRNSVRELLNCLKMDGKRIAAYGAAAKGSVLLNYFGVDHELIDFVVDGSRYKQGLHMPGVHIPICPESKLLEEMPDYVVLLAWNFEDFILEK